MTRYSRGETLRESKIEVDRDACNKRTRPQKGSNLAFKTCCKQSDQNGTMRGRLILHDDEAPCRTIFDFRLILLWGKRKREVGGKERGESGDRIQSRKNEGHLLTH